MAASISPFNTIKRKPHPLSSALQAALRLESPWAPRAEGMRSPSMSFGGTIAQNKEHCTERREAQVLVLVLPLASCMVLTEQVISFPKPRCPHPHDNVELAGFSLSFPPILAQDEVTHCNLSVISSPNYSQSRNFLKEVRMEQDDPGTRDRVWLP